jgi:hypothetical protein
MPRQSRNAQHRDRRSRSGRSASPSSHHETAVRARGSESPPRQTRRALSPGHRRSRLSTPSLALRATSAGHRGSRSRTRITCLREHECASLHLFARGSTIETSCSSRGMSSWTVRTYGGRSAYATRCPHRERCRNGVPYRSIAGRPNCGRRLPSANHVIAEIRSRVKVSTNSAKPCATSVWDAGR